ncbi:MAG: hypothetical protein ACOC9P_01650 [bacterium]
MALIVLALVGFSLHEKKRTAAFQRKAQERGGAFEARSHLPHEDLNRCELLSTSKGTYPVICNRIELIGNDRRLWLFDLGQHTSTGQTRNMWIGTFVAVRSSQPMASTAPTVTERRDPETGAELRVKVEVKGPWLVFCPLAARASVSRRAKPKELGMLVRLGDELARQTSHDERLS